MIEKIKSFFDIRFWKFILVGILNTIVGTGLQFLLYNITPLKTIGDIGTWIASFISYFVGSVMSYFLNKYFTFKNKEKGLKPVIRFTINIAFCFFIAYGIAIPLISFICTSNQISMFAWSVDTFAGNLSMALGSCLFVALNYIGQRFFAFKNN